MIEVLVSLSLATVLLLSCVGMISMSRRVTRRMDNRSALKVLKAAQVMQRDWRSVYLPAALWEDEDAEVDSPSVSGRPDPEHAESSAVEIHVLALARAGRVLRVRKRVIYYVRSNGNGTVDLMRREETLGDASGPHEVVLLSGLRACKVRFLSERGSWSSEWRSKSLPRGVEVVIGAERDFRFVVPIMSGRSVPD